MHGQKRIRDYGINIGELPVGPFNAITDVRGVKVGHCTLDNGDMKTGVTAIIPHSGNTFLEKLPAAVHVINGFGKSVGTIQVAELGTVETPLILTNTFGVGTAVNALTRYMLENNADVGTDTGTVNPLVFECNDSYLNNIRGMCVKEEHVRNALTVAEAEFLEGGVGAGTGMSCYKLKGGIGSSSRKLEMNSSSYTLGMLVLTNMGRLRDLTVAGRQIGREIKYSRSSGEEEGDRGSIIIVVATDLPLSSRQLGRIARRAECGVARTGNNISTGSGEIVIAFSTAQNILHYEQRDIIEQRMLNEEKIDPVFQAVAECAEEAVLNSMITADRSSGRAGHVRESLKRYL